MKLNGYRRLYVTYKLQKKMIDLYKIIDRAVEEGVAYGYRRAHKHTDKPSEQAIREQIKQAVMNELSEVIEWE